jgi:hypothetical protein
MPEPKLTPAQQEMLDEIKETKSGIMYIRRSSRFYRTIEILERRGLVFKAEPDYSTWGQDGWKLKEAPEVPPLPGPLPNIDMTKAKGAMPYLSPTPQAAHVSPEAPQPVSKVTGAREVAHPADVSFKAPRTAARAVARATARAKATLPRPPDLNVALRARLRDELKAQGYHVDTYDPDFVVGVVIGFLSDNDAVLTATGVRRYKRDRR